ncbi:hypothetical protein [Vibrio cholerae]|uniref:hypothetical protein n=1 Tax=Vibrio cholerae TaxID=666 RepID=UPI0030810356
MPQSVEELYGYIGQSMYDSLPDEWVVSWLDVCIDTRKCRANIMPFFMEKAEVRKSTSFIMPVDLEQCFVAMHSYFQQSQEDKAWNKCRFILRPDGDFDLEFKFDRDLDYLYSLAGGDVARVEESLVNAIRSWSGLKEDAYRPWVN